MFAMSAARSDCAHADRKGGFAELRERHIEKRKGVRGNAGTSIPTAFGTDCDNELMHLRTPDQTWHRDGKR
jgi:hypothetical protein